MSGMVSITGAHATDPGALRERYRREREARIRDDGNAQFQELSGVLAHFRDDPWAAPSVERGGVDEEVDVVVIGGGFGGLLAAALLRNSGVDSLRVVEKGTDFGGVWYWNRYPGAQCDIDASVYLPLLEEMNYIPQQKYASGAEIFEYCKMIARKYDLYKDALLGTEVSHAEWDEKSSRWAITTDKGDLLRARFLVTSPGGQHRPRLPGVPGLERFKGHVFHTSRWDYAYTGGDTSGHMTGLTGKRVGVIGTGATAVQCVPYLAETATHLFVFQRTPPVVGVRGQQPTDPEWAADLQPGWQRRRMENFLGILTGQDEDEDLVNDGWTHAMRALDPGSAGPAIHSGSDSPSAEDQSELADFQLMEQVRARVDQLLLNPETADQLKPYYRFWCKRPLFSDTYLQTFNRPNVSLIDTAGQGVDRITENGVLAGGKEVKLDCLVLATGFDVGRGYLRTAGFEVVGREGVRLSEAWSKGPQTFQGFHSVGFPNCFFMGNTQTGINVNFVHSLWEQARHINYLIQTCRQLGGTSVETNSTAQDEWGAVFTERMHEFVRFHMECTPSYFNNEGNPDDPNGILANRYPDGALAFFRLLERWRDSGSLDGLQIS